MLLWLGNHSRCRCDLGRLFRRPGGWSLHASQRLFKERQRKSLKRNYHLDSCFSRNIKEDSIHDHNIQSNHSQKQFSQLFWQSWDFSFNSFNLPQRASVLPSYFASFPLFPFPLLLIPQILGFRLLKRKFSQRERKSVALVRQITTPS